MIDAPAPVDANPRNTIQPTMGMQSVRPIVRRPTISAPSSEAGLEAICC
jgi:hypothetical protein